VTPRRPESGVRDQGDKEGMTPRRPESVGTKSSRGWNSASFITVRPWKLRCPAPRLRSSGGVTVFSGYVIRSPGLKYSILDKMLSEL
jgi:hypothetical protein